MTFEYSCFISYRHCTQELGRRIIKEFHDVLAGELEMHGRKVFIDQERLKGGDFYNEILATDLCRSVCMLLVYWPDYFDLEHTYCAREYQAMRGLEAHRLKLLKSVKERRHGLIIPAVFRGNLPSEVRNKRLSKDFSYFQTSSPRLNRHARSVTMIREIAEYIDGRCRAFERLDADPFLNCNDFTLPPEEEVRPWIAEIKGAAAPFPGRKRGAP